MRGEEQLGAEGLRGLHPPEGVARHRRAEIIAVGAADGVGHRDGECGCPIFTGRVDHGGQPVGGQERADGVVDEHEVGVRRQRGEPLPHRRLPRRPAFDDGVQLRQPRRFQFVAQRIRCAGRTGDDERIDLRVSLEHFQRPHEHGCPAERAELLALAAHPAAHSSSRNHDGNFPFSHNIFKHVGAQCIAPLR